MLMTTLNDRALQALQQACKGFQEALESLRRVCMGLLPQIRERLQEVQNAEIQEHLKDIQQNYTENFDTMLNLDLESLHEDIPPRVKHLAYHHRKLRVRKKNLSRIETIQRKCNNVTKPNLIES